MVPQWDWTEAYKCITHGMHRDTGVYIIGDKIWITCISMRWDCIKKMCRKKHAAIWKNHSYGNQCKASHNDKLTWIFKQRELESWTIAVHSRHWRAHQNNLRIWARTLITRAMHRNQQEAFEHTDNACSELSVAYCMKKLNWRGILVTGHNEIVNGFTEAWHKGLCPLSTVNYILQL